MNKYLLVSGAMIGLLAGAGLGACGSSSNGSASTGNGTSSSTSGAGTGSGTGGAGGAGGAAAAGGGGSGSGGSNPDGGTCKPPSTLHPPAADAGTETLFCPFSSPDGGRDLRCNYETQHCCEPKTGTADCQSNSTPCPTGDTDWHCEDPTQCPSGQQCCATGTLVKSTDPACANTATNFRETHCATACKPSEITMCSTNAECPAGKTCTPFRAKGAQVGGCD